LVRATLGLITIAREGFGESELEDMVSTMEDVLDDVYEWWNPPFRRLPPMLISRITADLGSYLTRRKASGGGNWGYAWYHRQFWEAAEERYLGWGDRVLLARVVASYYKEQVPPDRHITPQPLRYGSTSSYSGPVNLRRCSELPHALMQAGESGLTECAQLLSNFFFVKAKVGGHVLPSCDRECEPRHSPPHDASDCYSTFIP